MVVLAFYGGVREKGGNKILLREDSTGLFLDFGLSFSRRTKFYEEFLSPRPHSTIKDLLALGLIPALKDIYRDDPVGGIPLEKEHPQVNAVLLSHSHADHANYISLLHPLITLYISEPARRILASIEECSKVSLEREIIHYYYRKPRGQSEKRPRPLEVVEENNPFSIGNISVKAFKVDHSVPGALGYILHTSSGPIAYTGDFRLHGAQASLTRNFLQVLKETKPRILITEGTNIDQPGGPKEEDIRQHIDEVLKRSQGKMVFCAFAPQDMYRLETFYKLSREAGRKLVVNHKTAHVLASLADCKLDVPQIDDVFIYNQKKKQQDFYAENVYASWERPYANRENSVCADVLQKNPGDYIIYLDYYSLGELIDINPPPGAVMIHSQAETFDREMEFDFVRFRNWLEYFRIRYEHAHASGHVYGNQLQELIQEINPEILIPIHTENPEAFLGLAKDVRLVTEGEKICF